jgi:hypothetical protein
MMIRQMVMTKIVTVSARSFLSSKKFTPTVSLIEILKNRKMNMDVKTKVSQYNRALPKLFFNDRRASLNIIN